MQFTESSSSSSTSIPNAKWDWSGLCLIVLLATICGCTTSHPIETEASRPFNFQTDTFSYPNELVWEYRFDANGKWVSKPRKPEPEYTHHCFVVARSARQFFEHARFDPQQPIADNATYRRLVQKVLSTGPSHVVPDSAKVVIPGYPDLHAFSLAQEGLLKEECGGAWHSYFQHGHWRIMLPFSRHGQQEMARQLVAAIQNNHPPVVHLIRFPQLTINHAIVLFAAAEADHEIQFQAYDPNDPRAPVPLTFSRDTRTFQFPTNDYFPGGPVDVYEVYLNWRY